MAWPHDPQLAPVAVSQLAAWEELAAGWEWSPRGPVAQCSRCGRGLALLRDEAGNPYRYTDEQWRALVVLHLRNWHADLDPDAP